MVPTQSDDNSLNDGLLDELDSLKVILQNKNNSGSFSAQSMDSLSSTDSKSIPVLQDAINASVPQGETLDLIEEINQLGKMQGQSETELEALVERILDQKVDEVRQQLKHSILKELQQYLKDNYPSQ